MARSGKSVDPEVSSIRPTASARAWVMRLIAVLAVPALLLGALEVGLRMAGYGYPTGFFELKRVDGERFYYTNQKFGYRFFPPAVARSPIPQRVPVERPSDTYRIILFGESAANGDPEPAYGVGRFLDVMLEERFPEMDFEVVCTAITAINSHVILPIARDAADLDADLWIIYMGNNEMVGPYGASTVFGSKAPPVPLVRATLALKATRIGQLISNLVRRNADSLSGEPDVWGGINMFTEDPLGPDAPERMQVYDNFAANLEDILQAGKAANVPVVLSTVASNLLHCAPFASVNSDTLTDAQLSEWSDFFEKGRSLDAVAVFPEALEAYKAAAEIDPSHAALQYRMGSVYGQIGDLEKAREMLTLARDLDALPVRADTRINQIIEEAAKRHSDRVIFADTMNLFAQDSFAGLPGRNLFYEHVHFTLDGTYKLARILAEKVESTLPAEARESRAKTWATPQIIQRRLAITVSDRARVWTEMKARLATPPYNARAGSSAHVAYAAEQADELRKRTNLRLDRVVYEEALAAMPEDYLLRARLGSFLMNTGSLDAAIVQLEVVCALFPEFEGGFQELGIAQFLAEKYPEARASFERVLELRPGYAKAEKALELMGSDPRYASPE